MLSDLLMLPARLVCYFCFGERGLYKMYLGVLCPMIFFQLILNVTLCTVLEMFHE